MKQRPRVLLLMTQLGYGGAETSFIRLANYLAARMNVTIALFTPDYGREDYAKGHEAVQASIVLLDKVGDSKLMRWARRIRAVRALKQQHDVTISFLSGPNLVNVLAGKNARSVVSVRGSRLYDPIAPKLQNAFFRYLLDPIVYGLAGRIVPISPGLIEEIRLAAGNGAASRAQTITPFFDLSALAHRRSLPVPKEYELLRGQPVIVAAGRLSVEKGFDHLIRIFYALSQQQPGIKLLLVGDGLQHQALQAHCATLQVPINDMSPGRTSVIFTGYQADVVPFMQLASVFVLSSLTEGFGNVLLEALAVGLPVLANDAPWGARFILGDTDSRLPHPTFRPRATAYGTLMPRIDLAKSELQWVTALGDALQTATRTDHRAYLVRFDMAAVGVQWEQLIVTMLHPSPDEKQPTLYVVDPSTATTGALVGARNTARAVAETMQTVLVLPNHSAVTPTMAPEFSRVMYLPLCNPSARLSHLPRYMFSILYTSIALRRAMVKDGARHLILNDFYLMHGPLLRLLGYRGRILQWVRCHPHYFAGALANPMLRLLYMTANHVISVSDFIQKLLPVTNSNHLIYDYTTRSVAAASAQARGVKRFVFVGNYIPGKGQDIALEAFAKLRDADDVRLEFYGGDMGLAKNRSYRETLHARAAALGIASRVIFGEFVTDHSTLLTGAYAALNFSSSESFSMTVLEASAAGLPVIATQSGGPAEIIEDGVSGILIPLADSAAAAGAMQMLIDQPARAHTMGLAGAVRVQTHFTKEAFDRTLLKLLSD